ncbi:MAG: MarR family transcriptional regulator [Bacteroidales bacterium]|nr:MarR family transcriptional regulator [Bacteroidales bacterium]
MIYEQLKLNNQLCFPVYAASRLIIREYQPYLDALGITYPQYLVMMVLWEKDQQSVIEIAYKLILNTNTITPLLKRMESQGLVQREKSDHDERKVIISLTEKGKLLQDQAAQVPLKLIERITQTGMEPEMLLQLKQEIDFLVTALQKDNPEQKQK